MVDVRDVELRYGKVTQTLDISDKPITDMSLARSVFMDRFKDLTQEVFAVLLLNTRKKIINFHVISMGTLTESLIHPREVFRSAIKAGSHSLIIGHNHPSGDPRPSSEDEAVTKRLVKCGHILGIPLIDHIIIADPDLSFSVKEERPDWLLQGE